MNNYIYYDKDNFKDAFHLIDKEVEFISSQDNSRGKAILTSIRGGNFPFVSQGGFSMKAIREPKYITYCETCQQKVI
jgi:hypothetical protein